MIWFTCKQCGKTHGRPETAAGSMVFCDCGQGNLVPWESTAAEPPSPLPVIAPSLPESPKLEPLSFQPDPAPPRELPPPPVRGSYLGRRSRPRRRVDPNYCLNHETVAQQGMCADCGEPFCPACLVTFKNQPLCGPCKNFRTRALQRPPVLSTLAVISVLLALLTGIMALCLVLAQTSGPRWLGLIALAPHGIALALGLKALRDTEVNSKISGRGLAITGVLTSLVASVLTVILTAQGSRM